MLRGSLGLVHSAAARGVKFYLFLIRLRPNKPCAPVELILILSSAAKFVVIYHYHPIYFNLISANFC